MVVSAKRPTVFEAKKTQADKYTWSFVVPQALVTSMQAAIETRYEQHATARGVDGRPDEVNLADSDSETQQHAVVKLRTNIVFFSSEGDKNG
ncbi:hypothetical protein PInf_025245 [Phytophthora infestans]|nr:hypothetical protein PInf_025245 [Phytophthora infestans]